MLHCVLHFLRGIPMVVTIPAPNFLILFLFYRSFTFKSEQQQQKQPTVLVFIALLSARWLYARACVCVSLWNAHDRRQWSLTCSSSNNNYHNYNNSYNKGSNKQQHTHIIHCELHAGM